MTYIYEIKLMKLSYYKKNKKILGYSNKSDELLKI